MEVGNNGVVIEARSHTVVDGCVIRFIPPSSAEAVKNAVA